MPGIRSYRRAQRRRGEALVLTALTSSGSKCPFHNYTASTCGLASFPRKRESRRRGAWGLDACFRRHDILLASDLRNGHLDVQQVGRRTSRLVRVHSLRGVRSISGQAPCLREATLGRYAAFDCRVRLCGRRHPEYCAQEIRSGFHTRQTSLVSQGAPAKLAGQLPCAALSSLGEQHG